MVKEATNSYVSNELYKQITDAFPVICVDVVPVDIKHGLIGTITRATGRDANKLALVGGRIRKNETISQAILRHIQTDLGLNNFSFLPTNSEDAPFLVQQYGHGNAKTEKFECYDPTKHSIGLTYIIEIKETPEPKHEASEFHWLGINDIPKDTAFNQGVVMKKILKSIV